MERWLSGLRHTLGKRAYGFRTAGSNPALSANVVKSRTHGFYSFFYYFVGFPLGYEGRALAVADAEIDDALVVVGVDGNNQVV